MGCERQKYLYISPRSCKRNEGHEGHEESLLNAVAPLEWAEINLLAAESEHIYGQSSEEAKLNLAKNSC